MDATQKMQLFQILLYVSIGVAVIGLILAILFFFLFNIRDIYALRTGKAKRAAIERMSERNNQTGQLSTQPQTSSQLSGAPSSPIADNLTNGSYAESAPSDAEGTSVLNTSAGDTTVLGTSDNETTVLRSPTPEKTVSVPAAKTQPSFAGFEVTENTVVIHTDEFI